MQIRLFGMETEFGLTILDTAGKPLTNNEAARRFLSACEKTLVYLPGNRGRMYLRNAGLLYIDCLHPEYATAECPTPTALLLNQRGGERLLLRAARHLESDSDISEVRLLRTNVDHTQPDTTWGCHENYMTTRHPRLFGAALIPHLASRIVFTGSGGLDATLSNFHFLLSPRALHLTSTNGDADGNRRAIYNIRNEPLTRTNHHRIHLMCGDTVCSDLANYLKFGTTALVVALTEAGRAPADAVALAAPLQAMQQFARDPSCTAKVEMASGHRVTAIGIQRHYLQMAQEAVGKPFMPHWAAEVCGRWRWVLDRLEEDPGSLEMALDWPTKLAVFRRFVEQHSPMSWDDLSRYAAVARSIGMRERRQATDDQSVPVHRPPSATSEQRWSSNIREQGLPTISLQAYSNLVASLGELDVCFGELGERGIYTSLERSGAVKQRLIDDDMIERNVELPPAFGRAMIRGECVSRLAGTEDHYTCGWTFVASRDRWLDLGDPLETRERWCSRSTETPCPSFLLEVSDDI